MAFVNDTFTDADGTRLALHTGEIGATWTAHPSGLNDTLVTLIQSGRVYDTDNNNMFYASGVPASADYDVEGDIFVASLIGSRYVTGRHSTSVDTFYLAGYDAPTQKWRLQKRVAGTFTAVDSGGVVDAGMTVGVSKRVKLEMRGTTLNLYVAGVLTITTTDSSIVAAGRAGIRGAAESTTTGLHLDNFTATDAVAGSAPQGPEYMPNRISLLGDKQAVKRGAFFCLGDKWARRRRSGLLVPSAHAIG